MNEYEIDYARVPEAMVDEKLRAEIMGIVRGEPVAPLAGELRGKLDDPVGKLIALVVLLDAYLIFGEDRYRQANADEARRLGEHSWAHKEYLLSILANILMSEQKE